MERFSTCWDDVDYPYLLPLADSPGHSVDAGCFCDTDDEEILSQVLNNYDRETTDFFRWTRRYDRAYLSELVGRRRGMHVGRLKSLEPLERGASGRIMKLRITGEDDTFTVGKELEIRRLLSDTHLKSSAFEVRYIDACGNECACGDDWTEIELDGRGWGHGVGLCQIGAAVMAARGYDYQEILQHYYPGTDL